MLTILSLFQDNKLNKSECCNCKCLEGISGCCFFYKCEKVFSDVFRFQLKQI